MGLAVGAKSEVLRKKFSMQKNYKFATDWVNDIFRYGKRRDVKLLFDGRHYILSSPRTMSIEVNNESEKALSIRRNHS